MDQRIVSALMAIREKNTQMYALITTMESIKAEVCGMVAANSARSTNGESQAYPESCFSNAADTLRDIAKTLEVDEY